ncbi:hypothetical protein BAY68_13380 [Bacillus pumilus]|nr:hypothetical protein BAY68_13380 [Bacillus pumilus]
MSELFKTAYPYCFITMAMSAAPQMRKKVLVRYIKTYMAKYEPHLELIDIKGKYAICRLKRK